MTKHRDFREDYGVYACEHVCNGTRPVLLVVRDDDGSWQFLCDQPNCVDESEPRHICIGHLLEHDKSLNHTARLEISQLCERRSISEPWVHSDL